jgi:hypothetical protein
MEGIGCKMCGIEKTKNSLISNLHTFIKKATKIHSGLYTYNNSVYKGCKIKIEISCKKHGSFYQTPHNHITGKQGCPKCKTSKGELEIMKFLEKNNINYIYQKRFHDCKHKKYLSFDFYVSNENICIEFDGLQHKIPNNFFGGKIGFKNTKIRDKIKNEYCIKNNIKLIRISDIKKVQEILGKEFGILTISSLK